MRSITISAFIAAELTSATAVKALMVMERMIKALLVDELRTVGQRQLIHQQRFYHALHHHQRLHRRGTNQSRGSEGADGDGAQVKGAAGGSATSVQSAVRNSSTSSAFIHHHQRLHCRGSG